MTVEEVADILGLEFLAGKGEASHQVTGGYCSDLLSDVMANAREGDLWLTLQAHMNVVAVATLVKLAGVVVTGGREVEPRVVAKAEEKGVCLLRSARPTFELAGALWELLKKEGR